MNWPIQDPAGGGHVRRRLQVQERLTRQVADFLNELLHLVGVVVVMMEALHLCSMMREARKNNARSAQA